MKLLKVIEELMELPVSSDGVMTAEFLSEEDGIIELAVSLTECPDVLNMQVFEDGIEVLPWQDFTIDFEEASIEDVIEDVIDDLPVDIDDCQSVTTMTPSNNLKLWIMSLPARQQQFVATCLYHLPEALAREHARLKRVEQAAMAMLN